MSETSINPVPSLLPCKHKLCTGYPLGRSGRVLLGIGSLCLAAGFALAYSLEPDPRGYGTHQRLGLPPCGFHLLFNVSCPSCGSTTSFAHFVRGEWASSARSNPAAFLLAIACAAAIPWSWYGVIRGHLWRVHEPGTVCLRLLLAFCVLALVQWAVRIQWY
jgi:hypothetical protein